VQYSAYVFRNHLILTEVDVCSFEMFVTTYQNTRCNLPVDQAMNLTLPLDAAVQIFSCEPLLRR
jgi:hypothetical protein